MRIRAIWILGLGVLAAACGGGNAPAPPEPAQAVTAEPATAEPAGPATTEKIMNRRRRTRNAQVLNLLIGWAELAPAYEGRMDERGKTRSKDDADALANELLERARAGENFRLLMREYSEDWGSAETGKSYTATPEAQLVSPFKALSLRLDVDEIGMVESIYGWHIIKRIK